MIVFLVTVIVIGVLLEFASIRGRRNPISYSCKPSVKGCEPGERFELETEFRYMGVIPALYVQIEEYFPKSLQVTENRILTVVKQSDRLIQKCGLFIRSKECIRRKQMVSLPERGVYTFEGCKVSQGDFLGLKQMEWEVKGQSNVYVYPQQFKSNPLKKNLEQMYKEIALCHSLLRDTIQVVGYHDYTGQEPMKQIHFMQSARQSKLMVREFEYVEEQRLNLVLDLNYKGEMEYHFERLEHLLSVTRTVVEWLERKGIPYQLITNASIPGYKVEIQSFTGDGRQNKSSLKRILQVLARTNCGAVCSTEQLWNYVTIHKCSEVMIYMATAKEKQTEQYLRDLRRQNIQVYPFYSSEQK